MADFSNIMPRKRPGDSRPRRTGRRDLLPKTIQETHVQTIVIRDENNIPRILIGYQKEGF